ncbi:RIP metalloprotease RseP [Sulfurovum sp. bin170]|uniref:RIP metalloprotease RseP n=1 Tax=Sulfurovum sp. bin170 TaxID=2695268 RepID=UPI0013DEFAD5|nr:RIP metalloprotease RseP [Sulfurovum sp. bin170]NEW59703.1 RIP metalloprotease RseP [Sulfurovum sp. bin170]
MGIFVALLVLSFLIFFHELGHFLAARLFGVRVDVFSIGFGKKIFTKQIGQTEWSISAIPLGGYVKMKGQDDSDPTAVNYDSDSYTRKRPWQRIIILLAGPFANFFVAFMLYFGASQIGTYLSPLFNYSHYLPATVGSFSDESPAKKAGIEQGDRIVSINSTPINNWEDVGETIQLFDGVLYFDIIRDNRQLNIGVEPIIKKQKNRFGESVDRKLIGIAPDAPDELTFSPMEGLAFAWNETIHASTLIFTSVQKLISGDVPANQLGGVVTIVDITAKASQSGIIALLFFTALISVNLGVLNLLPIPALDGGHIGFNLYEMITGKTASEEVMYRLTLVGWGLLLSLMLLGLYNDINRLLG